MPFDFNDFKGAATRLDSLDISLLAHRIAVGEDEVHAFAEVEAAGSGFDRQGRPKMLFEPHVFYRNLKGAERDQAVRAGLAYRRWGERPYPADSYDRLKQAQEINQSAALKSASWGRFQVLGENYAMCGYASVEQMVKEMMEDEENHLEAGINYILSAGIDDDLRRLAALTRATRPEDCVSIVRVYNGPGYARNNYHVKFAKAHNKWRGIPDTVWNPDVPDSQGPGIENGEQLKQVQLRLRELGYHEAGNPDGIWGTKSRAAVLAFRADNDLPIYAGVDKELLSALMLAPPRAIAETRAEATVEDLREAGSRTIHDADTTETAGKVATGVGIVVGAGEIVDQLSEKVGVLNGLADQLQPLQAFVTDNIWLVLIGVGGFVVWKSGLIKKWRLFDHQEGKNAGPVG